MGVPLPFERTNVYISYDPTTEHGKNLRRWGTGTLDHFPGIHVTIRESKPRNAPTCPDCHREIGTCPHCQGRMERRIEKGIDTAIVTDMIKLAWEDAWDVAILVSSDRDFIPAVEFLTNKGLRVLNARFAPQGFHLASKCWASVDLSLHLRGLAR